MKWIISYKNIESQKYIRRMRIVKPGKINKIKLIKLSLLPLSLLQNNQPNKFWPKWLNPRLKQEKYIVVHFLVPESQKVLENSLGMMKDTVFRVKRLPLAKPELIWEWKWKTTAIDYKTTNKNRIHSIIILPKVSKWMNGWMFFFTRNDLELKTTIFLAPW